MVSTILRQTFLQQSRSPSIRQISYSCRRLNGALKSGPSHNSVNPDEIAHFSKLSSEWWDEQGEFSFLHKMNPVRMQFIRDRIFEVAQEENPGLSSKPHQALQGLDILDVGCGGGLLSESLARMGANTLGIDASQSNIAIASSHASADPALKPASGRSNLRYRNAPAETLLLEPKRYDVVCSMEVLEHVENPADFLSTCAELLKPGGHLFLSTIARTPTAYFLTILVAEDILGKVSKGTHTYAKYIKPSELLDYFRDYHSPPNNQLKTSPPVSSRPWITSPSSTTYLNRSEADIRGLIYKPLAARWSLAPRDAWWALECNYMLWVRKPKEPYAAAR
ncbi:S-adenosyl-L-methionine-dependent methyltransferase [Crepidotus variabilis]|uniref:Ubiquinone biosynthesis O-methyltransferase, mitochondrial n=1 Tax=Crepidotus variabilis TaxID=179855 RepID=A0A9P6EKB3_9AGAR|nr:S-adenosyl-L-methionine-dependent methyltransferase [Crepidotus variabilis]